MMRADRLGDEVERVAADLAHGARAFQAEAVRAFDQEIEIGVAHAYEQPAPHDLAVDVEQLAQERAASTIDLPLVEEGIEIGKKMMAEMIATYQGPPSTGGAKPTLNEVSPLTAREGEASPKFAS